MPFIKVDPEEVGTGQRIHLPEEQESPSVMETLDAGYRKHNWLTRVIYNERNPYTGSNKQIDPTHDALSDENLKGYENRATWLAESTSPQETAWIKRQIDQDRQLDDTLSRAGWGGTVASIATGLATPDVFLGGASVVSKVIKGGQVARTLALGALQGGISGALNEYGQSYGNPTVGADDIAKEAALWTIAGGAMGGVLAKLAPAERRAAVSGVEHFLSDVPHAAANARSTTASNVTEQLAANESRAAESSVLKQEAAPARNTASDLKENNGSIFDSLDAEPINEALKSAGGAEKLHFAQPMGTLANSPFQYGKRIGQMLFSDLRFRVKNEEGIATLPAVEDEIRLMEGVNATVRDANRQGYAEYLRNWSHPDTVAYVESKYGKSKLTFREFDREGGVAMSNADSHVIPEVQQVARLTRQAIEPVANAAVQHGLLAGVTDLKGTAESYFGRSYNRKKIIAEEPAVRQVLHERFVRDNPTMTVAEIEAAVTKAVEHLKNTPDGSLVSIKGGGLNSPFKSRELVVDDNVLEPWLNKSLEDFTSRYLHSVGKSVAFHKFFGDTSMSRVFEDLHGEYKMQVSAAKTDAERTKLFREYEKTVNAIKVGRDILQGRYKLPADPSSMFETMTRNLLTFNMVTKLGSAVIHSIGDVARPVLYHGLSPYLKTIANGLFSKETTKLIKKQNREFGIAVEAVSHTRMIAMSDIVEQYSRSGPITNATNWMGEKFGKAMWLDQWTDFWKSTTGVLANNTILRDSIQLSKGTLNQKSIENLARLGIDDVAANQIAAQFEKYGSKYKDDLHLSNVSEWDDEAAAGYFKRAVSKVTHNVINTPSAGSKVVTGINDKNVEALLTQFLSFNFASHMQTLIPALQQRDAATISFLVTSIIAGAVQNQVIDAAFNPRAKQSEIGSAAFWYEAIDKSGVFTVPFMFNQLASGATEGKIDAKRLVSDATNQSSRAKNLNLGSVLGPTGTVLADAYRVVSDVATDSETRKTTAAARRMIPFQNLFYIRRLFDMGEDYINDKYDLNKR